MIKPTIGRIVHYYDNRHCEAQAAMIVYVHSNECVNLCVFTNSGSTTPADSIHLRQPEKSQPLLGSWCEWMYYQGKKTAGSESDEKLAGTEVI